MKEPGIPKAEPERLAALRRLSILDTPPEERFDRYTQISTRLFDMPVSAISLVDRDRQWFKSTVGLTQHETPRCISFCGHAILGDDVFEVRNSRRDSRFRDNPLVINQPHICFYAGAPLRLSNGHKVGTLCIIDRIPRSLDADQKTMLKNLADIVIGEMTKFVDTETGLANRAGMMMVGESCFDARVAERSFSVLVFDINDFALRNETGSESSRVEAFSTLLRNHFPSAATIAHLGCNEFCVLIFDDANFDEETVIVGLLSDTEDIFTDKQASSFLSPLVGRVRYDFDKHSCFTDMLHEVDRRFVRRDRELLDEPQMWAPFIDRLMKYRKTIY